MIDKLVGQKLQDESRTQPAANKSTVIITACSSQITSPTALGPRLGHLRQGRLRPTPSREQMPDFTSAIVHSIVHFGRHRGRYGPAISPDPAAHKRTKPPNIGGLPP